MKKITVFLFLIVLISFSLHFDERTLPLFSFYSQGKCEFTVRKETNKDLPAFVSQVTSGENLFVKADIALGGYLQGILNDIQGITIFVEDETKNVLDNFAVKVCKTELQDNNTHIFGFSPYFEKSVFIDGKKCNIHIVVQVGRIIIGYPIILGSY